MKKEPVAERSSMPGYGISESPEGLSPWSWAVERLNRSQNFWLSTSRSDGRPHAMAVWAVWVDGELYFSTSQTTVKARNLARCPDCVVTTEQAADLVEVVSAYREKYGMPYPPDSAVYRVEPIVAFGFLEEASKFSTTATRWIFD